MKKDTQEWADAPFVNASITAELVFPQASVIGLALYDTTAETGETGHRDQPYRFRIPPQRARQLAQDLIALADALEGKDQQRQ